MILAFAATIFFLCLKQVLFETDHVIAIKQWQRRTANAAMRLTDCRGKDGECSQFATIAIACPSGTTSSIFTRIDVISRSQEKAQVSPSSSLRPAQSHHHPQRFLQLARELSRCDPRSP